MAVVRAHVDGLQRTAQPAANRHCRRCRRRCRCCRRCRRVGGTQGRIAADKPTGDIRRAGSGRKERGEQCRKQSADGYGNGSSDSRMRRETC